MLRLHFPGLDRSVSSLHFFLAMTEWQATGKPTTHFGIYSTMFLTWHLAHASVGVLLDFILKSSNGKLAKQACRKLLSVWLNYVNFVE